MKKSFILVLIICMIVMMFSITAFAEEAMSLDTNRIKRDSSLFMTAMDGGEATDELMENGKLVNSLGLIDSSNKDAGPLRFGSIFGEGSITMILFLLAIVLLITSICIIVSLRKNKKHLTSNKTEDEDEDEE